jgi:hypothetical protein
LHLFHNKLNGTWNYLESVDLEENGIKEEAETEDQSLQQHQGTNQSEDGETTPPTPELLIVEQQNREDHKCQLPHMKLEATGTSAAAGRQLNKGIKREITIGGEEEETQQQPTPKHVHPHCKVVLYLFQ